ncbi:MAG: hypothetical protein RSC09_06410 [Clostridia bacterium]
MQIYRVKQLIAKAKKIMEADNDDALSAIKKAELELELEEEEC